MNYDRPELLDRLAADYVFGSLSRRARQRFARLRGTLPAAEAAASEWEARTAPLALAVPLVAPSPQLWAALEQRIGGAEPRRRKGWGWLLRPALSFAFGVVMTVGLVRLYPDQVLTTSPQDQSLPASYVGLLLDREGSPTLLASSARHGRRMNIKMLKPVPVPPRKVLQLWALPEDAPPFPLGTVPAQGKGSFEMAGKSEQLLSKVSRLGVSLEDQTAAAGATPSTFILSGHCVKLW